MTTHDRLQANQEPTVIRQGRLKLWSMCLLSAAFVVAALLVPPSHVHGPTIHLAIGFFGLCAVVLGLQALSPGTLTLSPAGLVQRSLFRTATFQWSDFDGFRVRHLRRSAMVVGDLSEAGRAKLGWRRFSAGRETWAASGNCRLSASSTSSTRPWRAGVRQADARVPHGSSIIDAI